MKTFHYFIALFCLLTLISASSSTLAEDPVNEHQMPGIFDKTLGGKQYWGDVTFFHDWHIQQNVFTKHYRLLDGNDYRYAWGSWQTCKDALEEIKRRKRLPPMSGKAVVLVHGLLSNSSVFERMEDDLREAGYMPVSLVYPSGQVDINDAARYVQRSIESLEGIEDIYFVTHSLGGLVVRASLAAYPDERVKRIVLIGVPNTGAHLADLGEDNFIWRAIGGPAGQQLVTDPQGIIAALPQPPGEFAVIAGGRGDNSGYNPLVPGDDDGTVAVASTQLPACSDFSVVPCIHKYLPKNEQVRQQTLSFLRTGRLRNPAH